MNQPIAGIAGTKPRMSEPKPNGKLSKQESHALDREYRVQRNLALQLKNRREQMLSAKARGELVEKRLVQLQASFLLTAMSRRAMALPAAYCDRLAAAGDSLEAKAILDESMRGLLREVQDLPNCVNAAEWEKFLEEGDNGEPTESEGRPPKARTPRRRPKQGRL